MNKIDWRVLVTIIIGLVVIECVAMYYGINGTLRTVIVGILALIAGVAVPKEAILK